MGQQKTDLHDGWLRLEEMMSRRHGSSWPVQGMQAAYYMGALAALNSECPRDVLWKQAETGMQDSLRLPLSARFVPD
jgi:hypothetical protein